MGHRAILATVAAVLLAASCSTTPPSDLPEDETSPGPPDGAEPMPTALAVDSELGALDMAAVQEAFRDAFPVIDGCVRQGRQRLPFLGGAIEAFVRVDGEGAVRWAYLEHTELGDHRTESCIVDALSQRSWPKPSGGKDGEARQQLDFGEADERPPVDLSPDALGPRVRKVESALRRCRSQAGTSSLEVTFYVDPDGKPMAAGVAVADDKGPDAIDCAVRAIRSARYSSPGSYPGKVTIRVN